MSILGNVSNKEQLKDTYEEYCLDISNIPAGKYLVTVKDDKQYLTPKKIIIL